MNASSRPVISLKEIRKTVALKKAMNWALLAGAYAAVVVLFSSKDYFPGLRTSLAAGISFALALLVGFRINRSYDRWWEARKQWGSLVNVSRNLAVKVRELRQPELAERQRVHDLIVAFAYGLKDHLRNEPELQKLDGFETSQDSPGHLPTYLARQIYRLFYHWNNEGWLDAGRLLTLDSEARMMLEICGACERIKNTLMSTSWRAFSLQCIVLVLLILPLGLADEFGWVAVPATVLIAYLVVAGEVIARTVEEPFGFHEDQLNLQALCEAIDTSVGEALLDDCIGDK